MTPFDVSGNESLDIFLEDICEQFFKVCILTVLRISQRFQCTPLSTQCTIIQAPLSSKWLHRFVCVIYCWKGYYTV